MYIPVVEQCDVEEINIMKSGKFNFEKGWNAIQRINQIVHWEHDNGEIYSIIKYTPEFCYYAEINNHIVGYAIIREDGADKHLHISWLATDVINRGIGTLLMQKIIRKNKKLGKNSLTLFHKTENSRLKRFYERIAELESVKYLCEKVSDEEYRVTYEM